MPSPYVNIFSFAKRIGRPLILDGAMGSLLQQSGIRSDEYLWTSLASINHPALVLKIHKDYIDSGADIITTNTFRSNPYAVESSNKNYSSETLVKESLRIAKLSKGSLHILIAGSNAPAEDCYQVKRTIDIKVLESNHLRHINLLMNYGCDFILNETQSHMDEIDIICHYCNSKDIPFVLSIFLTEDLKLLSGENVFDVLGLIQSYKPLAIGFNCISIETFRKIMGQLNAELNWGIYLNCGSGNLTDEKIACGVNENEYWELIKSFLYLNPSFIGACCGSTPNHIKKIRENLNGIS